MTSCLRLCIAVFVFVGICSMAASQGSCPAGPADDFFIPTTFTSCYDVRFCFNTLCDCLLGSTAAATHYNTSKNAEACLAAATAVPCRKVQSCVASVFSCVQKSGETLKTSSNCSSWASKLFMAELDIGSTQDWNKSDAGKSCIRQVCEWKQNISSSCASNFTEVELCACASPIKQSFDLYLNGDWSAIDLNVFHGMIFDSLQKDFNAGFGKPACISAFVKTTDNKLKVTYSYPAQTGTPLNFTKTGETTFFANTKSFYDNHGGKGTFTSGGQVTAGQTTTTAPITTTTSTPSGTTTTGTPSGSTTKAPTTTAAPASTTGLSAIVAMILVIALSIIA